MDYLIPERQNEERPRLYLELPIDLPQKIDEPQEEPKRVIVIDTDVDDSEIFTIDL